MIRNYMKRRLLSFESIGSFCCNHWAHRPMRYLSLYLVGLNTSFDSHHTLWQSKTRHTKRWLFFLHSVLLGLLFFNWSPLEWDTIVLIWNVPEYRGLPSLNLMSQHLWATWPSVYMALHRFYTGVTIYAIPGCWNILLLMTIPSLWV